MLTEKKQFIKIGVIGCGQWGINHVRNFSYLLGSKGIICADLDKNRLETIRNTFINVKVTTDYKDIINDTQIKAVCIATQSASHYRLAKECLEHEKDVLCEKPLCTTIEEAEKLIAIAQEKKCILMVGHVFIFHPGISKLKEYIINNELGKIQYAHSERTNLGPFRYDVDAVFDLAAHDVSIFNYLFSKTPIEVSARGHRCLTEERDDLAFITLLYPNNILVNIHVSWIDPKKVRTVTIVGDKKMAFWDDLSAEGAIKLYDKHVEQKTLYYENFGEFQLLSKEGDITIPKIDLYEPLKEQDSHFIDCIENRKQPVSDGQTGLDVVKVLCAAEESIKRRGASIEVTKNSRKK